MNVFESSESSHIHVYVLMIQTSYLQNCVGPEQFWLSMTLESLGL